MTGMLRYPFRQPLFTICLHTPPLFLYRPQLLTLM